MALSLALLFVVFAYWETARSVFAVWLGPELTYQHGLAVLLLCALIAWREWNARAHDSLVQPSATALLLLALISFAWGLATLAAVDVVQSYGLLLVLAILPVALLGVRVASLLAFPFALIVVVWPVWDFLQPPLQELAARSSELALGWVGVPLHRNGTEIHLSSGLFLIERACSGLVFTLSGALAGLLFAYFARLGPVGTVAVAVGAGLVASVGNVIRIATVIYLGELTRMQHVFVTDDHSVFGWTVYAACTIAFLMLVRLFLPARAAAPAPRPAADVVHTTRRRLWGAALLSLAAASIGPSVVHAYRQPLQVDGSVPMELPTTLREWRAETSFGGMDAPVRLPADGAFSAQYARADGARVAVHLARYSHQRPGAEAVSRANTIYDDRYWTPVATRIRQFDDGFSVRETRLRAGNGEVRLLWRWYQVDSHATGRDIEASVHNVWNTLRGDPAVALVGVLAEGPDPEAQLDGFVAVARVALTDAVRRAGMAKGAVQ